MNIDLIHFSIEFVKVNSKGLYRESMHGDKLLQLSTPLAIYSITSMQPLTNMA